MRQNIISRLQYIHKRRLVFRIVFVFNLALFSQQAPHYAQYMYNMQVLNPAFVGSKSDFSASLLTRQQWIGVDGAPETTTFSANTRINAGFGFGATVVLDRIGLLNNTILDLDVSYTIPTSEFGRLSFGLKSGMAFFNNDLASGLTPDNEVYASRTGEYDNLGFGFLYTNSSFFVGASALNLLESPVFRLEDDIQQNANLENASYFLTAGAIFKFSKFKNLKFKPSTQIKHTPSLPISMDLNANFIYNDAFEAGISYRFNASSLSTMVSIHISESLRLGYAYENQLSQIGSNLNTHELMIRFDFDLKRNKRWLFDNCCYF